MPFYRCFYHIVWATKDRTPLIDAEREEVLYAFFAQKCQELKCELLAVNGTADHVHLMLAVPPTLTVTRIIKHLKGSSSREINQQFTCGEAIFHWQSGYSVFTCSEKLLPDALAYIANQKQRHSMGEIYAYYEQLGDD